MPNDINLTLNLHVNKGSLAFEKSAVNTIDMAGSHFSAQAQSIGITYEPLNINSDVATPGYAFFRNLDDTNFVEIGLEVSGTFHPLIKLLPGQAGCIPLSTTSLFAQADTAEVVLEHWILEA